jgi:hypothetical protein
MTTVKSKSSVRDALLIAIAITGCKKTEPTPDPAPLPVKAIDAAVVVPVDARVEVAIDAMPIDAGMPAREGAVAPEALVRDVRTFVAADMPDVVLGTVKAAYVRSDGTLDPTYGTLEIEFGVSSRPLELVDDPSRPTGAPLPPPPQETKQRHNDCPKHTWQMGAWRHKQGYCRKREPLIGPRCTAKQIWERAIANNAPKDALAVLTLDAPRDHASSAMWHFAISDRLRKVSVSKFYADDCPVAIEKGSASE